MKLPFGWWALSVLSLMRADAFVSITSARADTTGHAIQRLLAEFGVGGPGNGVVSVEAGPGDEMDGFRDV